VTETEIPHPTIVSPDEWLAERKKLLAHEKDLTHHYDRVNSERRRLPMVKIGKGYAFTGGVTEAAFVEFMTAPWRSRAFPTKPTS